MHQETTHKLVDSDGNVTLVFNQTIDIASTSFTQTLASISTAATTTANSGGSTIDFDLLGELDECWNSRFQCD